MMLGGFEGKDGVLGKCAGRGKRTSLLRWPAVETLFFLWDWSERKSAAWCQYSDRNLQGDERGRMWLLHMKLGRCTNRGRGR